MKAWAIFWWIVLVVCAANLAEISIIKWDPWKAILQISGMVVSLYFVRLNWRAE